MNVSASVSLLDSGKNRNTLDNTASHLEKSAIFSRHPRKMLERFEEENAGHELRINEIRTERLSRALQGMNSKKSCPVSRPKWHHAETFPGSDIDEEDEGERGCPINSINKPPLTRAHSGSTIDDVESLFRCRESSITRRNQFRSVRIPTSPYQQDFEKSTDKTDRDSGMVKPSQITPPSAFGLEKLNRVIRHFMSPPVLLDSNHNQSIQADRSQKNFHRARAKTVCHRVQLRIQKSPSPTPRHRSETESRAKTDSKIRKFNQQQNSKSASSNASSRSLSPKANVSVTLTTGMLGCMANEQQQLSPGSPLSPTYTDAKFTVLVVGSTCVGKTALINRFLQEDRRKASLRYDAGSFSNDNSVSVMVDGEESELRFIEVNNQKSDLWLSLSGAAFVVLYNFDDTNSFHNAIDVIARLRERVDTATKPVVLVSNKQTLERKRFVIANDDGRQVAKQNNCSFYEVFVSAGRSAVELLIGIAAEVRRHYLQRQADTSKCAEAATPEGDISPQLFDYTSSAVAGLGIGLLQPKRSLCVSQSAACKTSSLSTFGQKLWPRKKVKHCKSAEETDVATRNARNVSLVHGLQNCFFGARRGSRSLEALPVLAKSG